jgi:hypothetical protein
MPVNFFNMVLYENWKVKLYLPASSAAVLIYNFQQFFGCKLGKIFLVLPHNFFKRFHDKELS